MPLPARAAGASVAESRDPAPPAYPGVLLTLAEAAWAAGLTREELTDLIRRGALVARSLVRGRRVVTAVALKDLERLVAGLDRGTRDPGLEPAEARELELRVARLEGELAASSRVERSLQAYADKLETRMEAAVVGLERRLAASRRREMTLARMLGAAEARLEVARTGRLGPVPGTPRPASVASRS